MYDGETVEPMTIATAMAIDIADGTFGRGGVEWPNERWRQIEIGGSLSVGYRGPRKLLKEMKIIKIKMLAVGRWLVPGCCNRNR